MLRFVINILDPILPSEAAVADAVARGSEMNLEEVEKVIQEPAGLIVPGAERTITWADKVGVVAAWG